MQNIHIMTDSASDISKELALENNIEIIPITITINGKTFREYYDINIDEYIDILENDDEIPTTSQTTPPNYYDAFKKAKDNGITHILSVIINSKGSGSFQSANIARDMFYADFGKDMHIELIDSKLYSYIYGDTVVYAAQLKKQGVDFETILEKTKIKLSQAQGLLGVYKLDHLVKSGRISGGKAFIGSALGLKPISLVYNGNVEVIDKARGDKNLVKKLAEIANKNTENKDVAIIGYGKVAQEDIETLENLLKEYGFNEIKKCRIGASVLTNAGPNSIGVFYYKNNL